MEQVVAPTCGIPVAGIVLATTVDKPPALCTTVTTGSGKSELLRSLVAGMAANVDPDHLTFVRRAPSLRLGLRLR